MRKIRIQVDTDDGTVVFKKVEPGMSVGCPLEEAIQTGIGKKLPGHVSIRTHETRQDDPMPWLGGTISTFTGDETMTHVVINCNISYANGTYVDFNSQMIPLGCKMKVTFTDQVVVITE
jgi:hypothetical protein